MKLIIDVSETQNNNMLDVLDNIRAEMELFKMDDSSNIFMKAYNDGIENALKIIDRYREGVSN